jgi:hypothetical protein
MGQSENKMKKKIEEKYEEYLDELRESGSINMYGAVPFLQDEFGLDKKEAREILSAWMENY